MSLDAHFFRHEYGRLVAALVRVFGVHNLALAEDVAQDALCRALEVWKFRGVPDQPSAWLLTTAKHRALDALRRERTARTFAPELGRLLDSEWTLAPTVEALLAPGALRDDELRMMFSCCHPRLAEEAQVALVLHVLCGFDVREIASAFFTSEAAMAKRITRAKKVLAGSQRLFELGDARDVAARLAAVQRALYLLFNEGYHGACADAAVRGELCHEALRLVTVLREHAPAATPATEALAALMCLHAARLPARLDAAGELCALEDQDRAAWDRALIREGLARLERSATGTALSAYHVEAAIASVHACAARFEDTAWGQIVALYDTLMVLRPSPVVALNRAMALAQSEGAAQGLAAIGAIADRARLEGYPFYAAAQGELELRCGRAGVARAHFERALARARSAMEKRFFARRLRACEQMLRPVPTTRARVDPR